jgi:RHS repeat-associated protein
MKYPDGEIVTTGYNNNMLPTSVIGTDTYAQSIAYDSAMRMIQLVRGANKINTVFTYNAWNQDGGRLLNLTSTQVSTGTPLQNSTYDYDSVGNILTITDSLLGPQTQTFTYDELDRLINSDVSGGTDGRYTEAYTYDPASGNLSGKAGLTYTYASGHAHAVSSLSNGNTYGYDDNGNMTTRTVNGQIYNLAYDAENRLVSVTGAATANFVYDADGKQVKATVNGTTTVYVGNHYIIPLRDEVKNGTVTKYYFAGSTRLAARTGTALSYLLSDHIGSSSVTANANGEKTATALYKAFGETRYTLGNLGTDYKFTGQRDDSLGIYFFQSRWYDGSLGRFLSPDTIVPTSTQGTQAWDRYAFVNNNPVRYNDPTGHSAGPCYFCSIGQSILSSITNSYQLGWTNFGTALSIMGNPNVTWTQKGVATAYAVPWMWAHVAIVAAAIIVPGAAEPTAEVACELSVCNEVTEPTTDPLTGEPVGRFIAQPDGNTLIEPEGGSTTSSPDGKYVQTHYPDGSYYQRYDGVPGDPHGHGYNVEGLPIDTCGVPVDPNSPEAHWSVC